MTSEQSPAQTQHGLRGAYRCLLRHTELGPIRAAIHAPIFYLVGYRHAGDIAASTEVWEDE